MLDWIPYVAFFILLIIIGSIIYRKINDGFDKRFKEVQNRMDEKEKTLESQKAQFDALMNVMKELLKDLASKGQSQMYTTSEDRDKFAVFYALYEKLGGNGSITMFEKESFERLPHEEIFRAEHPSLYRTSKIAEGGSAWLSDLYCLVDERRNKTCSKEMADYECRNVLENYLDEKLGIQNAKDKMRVDSE